MGWCMVGLKKGILTSALCPKERVDKTWSLPEKGAQVKGIQTVAAVVLPFNLHEW